MVNPVARPAARAAPPPWPRQRISVVSVTPIDVAQILAGATAPPPVPIVNQIRIYWWCSPPRTGRQRMCRAARRRARLAYPSPRIDAYGPRCTTRRRNAHGIAERELLYPWHPWAGCLVHIHEVVEKAGREIFRCSLSGRATGRWLEIPAWMFDRAARAAWRVGAAPYVDIAVLTALATLLQDVTSVSGAPSQLRDSSAALGSQDANRGEVHAAPAYRSSPSSQQCTSVRSVLRPALRRGADAAMAGVARRDAPYADEADGPPDLRPRRRRPRSGTGGDAS